eukprot:361221-Chlamydomonas_euryale.AAC.3
MQITTGGLPTLPRSSNSPPPTSPPPPNTATMRLPDSVAAAAAAVSAASPAGRGRLLLRGTPTLILSRSLGWPSVPLASCDPFLFGTRVAVTRTRVGRKRSPVRRPNAFCIWAEKGRSSRCDMEV